MIYNNIWYIYILIKRIKNFTGELESHQVSTIYNLWKEWYTEYKKSSFYEDNHLEKARQTTHRTTFTMGRGGDMCMCANLEGQYHDESITAPVGVRRGAPTLGAFSHCPASLWRAGWPRQSWSCWNRPEWKKRTSVCVCGGGWLQ